MVRSERCSLTANAYTIANDIPYNRNIADTQWNNDSNQVISYSFGILGRDDAESIQIFRMQLNGRYVGHLNDDLAYTVIVKDTNYTQLYHAADTILGESIEVSLPPSSADSTEIAYRIQILVFRTDGSNIYHSDMYRANFTAWLSVVENVPENTLPADWFQSTAATTTSPFNTMTTIAGDLVADEDFVEQNLTTPPWIEGAVAQILALVAQIIQLKYVRFILGFVIVVSLVAWFLH